MWYSDRCAPYLKGIPTVLKSFMKDMKRLSLFSLYGNKTVITCSFSFIDRSLLHAHIKFYQIASFSFIKYFYRFPTFKMNSKNIIIEHLYLNLEQNSYQIIREVFYYYFSIADANWVIFFCCSAIGDNELCVQNYSYLGTWDRWR